MSAALAAWAVVAVGLAYVGWAYLVYAGGQAAAAGSSWQRAEESMARAVALDPALVFYRFELAFVRGRRAIESGDVDLLADAIRSYEAALAEDGTYALNHANLATLYWIAGKRQEAAAELQAALTLDGSKALYHVNLGLYDEQQGDTDAAVQSYGMAIRLDQSLIHQSFWRTSALRRDLWPRILREAGQETSPALLAVASDDALLSAEESPPAALPLLDQNVVRQPGLSQPLVERARAYLTHGELAKAEKDLRTAIFIDSNALAHYYLGEVAVHLGDQRLADEQFSRIAISRSMPMGYGYYVYRRVGIPAQYLPGFVEPLFGDQLVEPALGVASYYESLGRTDRAAGIYQRLIDYDSGLVPAREGLKRTNG